MSGVALLPEELTGSNEGSWVLELPADNVRPLVYLEGQVSMGVDPLLKGWVNDGLRGGSDGDRLV